MAVDNLITAKPLLKAMGYKKQKRLNLKNLSTQSTTYTQQPGKN